MKLGKRAKNIEVKLPRLSLERLERIPLLRLSYLSYFLSILTVSVVLLTRSHLPPEVPLYYGLPVSEEQLATSLELTLPGIFSLTIVSLNLILAFLIDDKFMQQAVIIAGFAVSFFSLVTTTKIIFLVGSL